MRASLCGGCAAVRWEEPAGPPGGWSWVSASLWSREAQGSSQPHILYCSAHLPNGARMGWAGPPSFCSAAFLPQRTRRRATAPRRFRLVSNLAARSVPFSASQAGAASLSSRCQAVWKWWRYVCFPRTKSLSKFGTNSQVIFNSYTAQPQMGYITDLQLQIWSDASDA